MKNSRKTIYLLLLMMMLSCAPEKKNLQTGDLLFQQTACSEMSQAITSATHRKQEINFTHVGIFIRNGADSVLEASSEGGVKMSSLSDFLEKSAKSEGQPLVVAMRLKDTTGVHQSIEYARKLLGAEYDFGFLPDNGKFYCSELVWEAYRDVQGRRLFRAHPMNFRNEDGTMPSYWVELFRGLNQPIPEGVKGTNPNDLSKEEKLKEVFRWF